VRGEVDRAKRGRVRGRYRDSELGGYVRDRAVRLTVTLRWLLARFVDAVQRVAGQRGEMMLEKK
jgi:hypothetical protein